jgi:hypothetical protein
MKLKCIGGTCDGKIQDIADHFREHDQVQIKGKIEFNLPSFEEDLQAFREGRTPDYMCVPYHYYKLAYIHFSKTSTLKFLIPMNWTSEDAIRHILGCADG